MASYNLAADSLVPEYEQLLFEDVHAPVLDLLPESPGTVLDIGAGSGRDAAWFEAQGHEVVAVEPSVEMRETGKVRHPSSRIRWMDDRLPDLDKVLRSKLSFDLVWLSAVWMHLPRGSRARAFRKLVSVLSPGGSMMLSLRLGPPPPGRPPPTSKHSPIDTACRSCVSKGAKTFPGGGEFPGRSSGCGFRTTVPARCRCCGTSSSTTRSRRRTNSRCCGRCSESPTAPAGSRARGATGITWSFRSDSWRCSGFAGFNG
ncbi:MAG: class I SAM-dependent methyltransferase [Proteobacteria bacterium]|nr:class I SAM-dependent methyltransferase [Pseudomonadota bacterium]